MADKETGARARLKKVEGAARTVPLSKFLKAIESRSRLSKSDRLRIVDQALLLPRDELCASPTQARDARY